MSRNNDAQTELFKAEAKYEYYPVLLPDEAVLENISALNKIFIELGLKQSNLTKLHHISIDGIICPENDTKVITNIRNFLSQQPTIAVEFTELGYFPARGGVILKLGIANPDVVTVFNKKFMDAIGGKTTKLNLHLTLARYVSREVLETIKNANLNYPKTCLCSSVALYKKEHKAKGAYEVICQVPFGE